MMQWILANVPPEGIGLVVTLFLSLMIGFQLEERRETKPTFFFGGARTYPLIAISGFLLTVVAPGDYIPFTAGLLVLGTLLAILYWSKVERDLPGFTTEFSALATYALGAVVASGEYWLALAATVVVVLLVHMKHVLENLAQRISAHEVATFAKFLIITAVILPVVPNREFTPFAINPYKAWLVVIAVSGISYASYLLQRRFHDRSGLFLASLLGGLYSSTATTVVLAKQAKGKADPSAYAGGIVMASGIMYLRILALLFLFGRPLFDRLALLFVALGLLALGGGGYWMWRILRRQAERNGAACESNRNPLELGTAFLFAAIFMGMLVATRFAFQQFGQTGVYGLALILGLVDVDPFILSLAQTPADAGFVATAAGAVVVATASNNLAKAGYAFAFGGVRLGRTALAMLVILSVLSVAALLVI